MENRFTSLIEAHQDLLSRGFDKNYNIINSYTMVDEDGKSYKPSQVSVDSFYRFEGASNPEDNSIIYGIKTKSGTKGTLVSAYGSGGSRKFSEFIMNIKDSQENTMLKKLNRAKDELVEMVQKRDKVIIAVVAGIAVGAVLGLLLAPKRKSLTERIVGKLKQMGDHGSTYKKNLESKIKDYSL